MMRLELVQTSACSKCGEPKQRKEYNIVHEGDSKGAITYSVWIDEKCKRCGRNFTHLE